MQRFVLNMFLMLLGAIVALVLYFVFFGQMTTGDGRSLFNENPYNEKWKGAIFYTAEMMEVPISMYYYNYCYLPSMSDYKYMDEALGYNIDSNSYKITDLSDNSVNGNIQKLPLVGTQSLNSTATYRSTTDWQ